MSKRIRTLDSFFSPPATKRTKPSHDGAFDAANPQQSSSKHPSYPLDIPALPTELREMLNFVPATEGRAINNQPDLDLLYFEPYIPKDAVRELFEFLRRDLFFYRVKYNIKRGPVETLINTPR